VEDLYLITPNRHPSQFIPLAEKVFLRHEDKSEKMRRKRWDL